MTGVDLSPYMLAVAKERAEANGVGVRWLAGDMREPLPGEVFDLVLNLFTSLGYFDDETCRVEPLANPFGPKVLPMSSV